MQKHNLEAVYAAARTEDQMIFTRNNEALAASSEKGLQRIRDNVPVFDANPAASCVVETPAVTSEQMSRATIKKTPIWWRGYRDPDQMPIEECREIVNRLFELYRRSLRYIQINEELGIARGNLIAHQEIVRLIELIIEELRSDHRLIITREYMNVPEPSWYVKYYSRSTFYRLRDEAVREFLRRIRKA